jgi:hypothetical protein
MLEQIRLPRALGSTLVDPGYSWVTRQMNLLSIGFSSTSPPLTSAAAFCRHNLCIIFPQGQGNHWGHCNRPKHNS